MPRVVHCSEYTANARVEPQVDKSDRCQGWRRVQFHKVFAMDDMVEHVGVDYLFLDTDHRVTDPALI